MKFKDLRDFVQQLEQRGELKRIQMPISPVLEMTEICDRTLRAKGPALLFENPTGFDIPVLGNLFGTPDRVAFGMGAESVSELREIGKLLAFLKEPEPPKGLKDAWSKLPIFRKIIAMAPKVVKDAVCQEVVIEGDDVDLAMLPGADLLAWRRWPADHLGPDRHQGPEQGSPEPRHLPSASDWPQQSDHALVEPPWRCAGLP